MAYIRCWACNGNGLCAYPYQPIETCPDCKGTGADAKKTAETRVVRSIARAGA